MSFSSLQRLLTGERPVTKSASALPALNTQIPKKQSGENPFMLAMNPDTPKFMGNYGVNKPLEKPMFLGYRDNKALFGGSKLFILY